MDNKFKVGDQVVNLKDLYLWNNSHHFKRFLKNAISVVEHVNSTQFSTNKAVDLSEHVSDKSWSSMDVYSQDNGQCLGDRSTVYHMVHDKDIIEKFLKNAFDIAERNIENEEAATLKDIESKIAELQLQADRIRNNTPDPKKFSSRRFTAERIEEMSRIFLSR